MEQTDLPPDASALPDEPADDLSLQEAALLWDVSVVTLRRRIAQGLLAGYKVRGPWGPEWRVPRAALTAAGAAPEERLHATSPVEDAPTAVLAPGRTAARLVALEHEVLSLRRVVAAERRRADRSDRELGFVLLERGRLRAALATALSTDARCESCPVLAALGPVGRGGIAVTHPGG